MSEADEALKRKNSCSAKSSGVFGLPLCSAYVGLNWASKNHDVRIQTKNSRESKFEVIKHSPEAIDEWLTHLHSEVEGSIAIAVELSSGPIVYVLQKYAYITAFRCWQKSTPYNETKYLKALRDRNSPLLNS